MDNVGNSNKELSPQIIQLIHGKEPVKTDLILDKEHLPATIGRDPKATYRVGHDPAIRMISRIHGTITLHENGIAFIRDGNGTPSANGLYVCGNRLTAPAPIISGCEIALTPPGAKDEIIIVWPRDIDQNATFDPPTLGYQNEILKGELRVTGDENKNLHQDLTQAASDISKMQGDIEGLKKELGRQKRTNRKQDERLRLQKRLLIIISLFSGVGVWFLSGGDINDLEKFENLGKALVSVLSLIGILMGFKDDNEDEGDQ